MNSLHHMAPFPLALLLPTLIATAVLAQTPADTMSVPEGVEATGDRVEVRALTAWADEHRWSHPEDARRVAERALALARDVGDQRGVAKSVTLLGNLAYQTSDLDRAESLFTAAREVYERIGDENGLIQNQLEMDILYVLRGDLEKTLPFYFDALDRFERLGNAEGQARALFIIGATHKVQGNLEEALAYFERAATLAETLDNPVLLLNILNASGSTLAVLGSYERAEPMLRRALDLSQEGGFRYFAAGTSSNLGLLYNAQGRHEQALPLLLTAERAGKELGEDGLLITVYDELGKAYMGLGRYNRALHYANESLALAREARLITREMETLQTLSRIYEASGDYEQALVHHRRYAAARDSVLNAEKAGIVAEMETRYETEGKQRAIERFEQENQIQALRQTLLLVGVGGLLLLLALLFNRYRLKQKANRLLEELDVAKSRFFANISHEFRTPLTVILGGLQDTIAGRFGTVSENVAAQQRAMLRNTRRLQGLIDEVLDLNRLEAGKLELNPAPGDLVRSIKRIVEVDAPLAERNGIDLTFEPSVEQCPRLYDPEKLEKIVGNLLSNALKFTPKGGSVEVELRCNGDVEILVTDDGPGIPAEAREKVFERFAQVEDGALHGGTGIGLALAKELAELHGGTITLESIPSLPPTRSGGEGSTFTVRLPLEKTTLVEIEATRQQNMESLPSEELIAGGDGESPSLIGKKGRGEGLDRTTILIIEDNADVRAYVRRSLEEMYRVLEAADGETGLQQARTELPDLIVSDVMLPGIDGYEVARQLKSEPGTECIPVVMLTARAAEDDHVAGYGSGAEVYITKPFSPETLRAAIARLLEERLRLRRRLQEHAKGVGEEASRNGHPTFSDRARTIFLDNLHDEDFGVRELASALSITRRTLYNHLQAEVGLSPSDFVRALRLERARELLSKGAGSVSEVAYAVGFKSLSHFTRSFQEHFRELPSTLLAWKTNAS